VASQLQIRLGSDSSQSKIAPSQFDFRRVLSPIVDEFSQAVAIEACFDARAMPDVVLALDGIQADGPDNATTYSFAVGEDSQEAVGNITANLAGVGRRPILPDAAVHVKASLGHAIRRGLSVQLVNGVSTPRFTSESQPPLMAEHMFREVETEIEAKVLWAGGAVPSARVRVSGSNQIVTVKLPSEQTARELGNHLYRYVMLTGTAKWIVDPSRFFRPTRLVEFSAKRCRTLPPLSTDRMFDVLAESTGGELDMIDPLAAWREEMAESEMAQ
jgi:hypothetical protein